MNRMFVILFAAALCALGCGKGDSARQPAPAETSHEAVTPQGEVDVESAAPEFESEPAPPVVEEPEETAAETVEPPAPVAEAHTGITAEPAPESTPPPVVEPEPETMTADVVDPGGVIEVAAPKPGLTRIGADKCKMCHKVQFESWSTTAHAQRTPPLDCEGCHGPGSEYKVMATMKDPALARAAGLVEPTRAFCQQCHVGEWNADFMVRAHAHKQ